MLENELTSYRGGQKPIAIKDTKGSKRRLTTGNIGRTLKEIWKQDKWYAWQSREH